MPLTSFRALDAGFIYEYAHFSSKIPIVQRKVSILMFILKELDLIGLRGATVPKPVRLPRLFEIEGFESVVFEDDQDVFAAGIGSDGEGVGVFWGVELGELFALSGNDD